MAKEVSMSKGKYETYWRNGERGMINVDVYVGPRSETNSPLIEWSYPKVVGSSILGNASFWLDQAIVQAQGEEENEISSTDFDSRRPGEPNPDEQPFVVR